MDDLTRILSALDRGDPKAADDLLPLVYDELRRLAARHLAREGPGQTLQPTALVHEAYVRLVDGREAVGWENRRHFFAAAAESMRRILVERARARRRLKRGGGLRRVELREDDCVDRARDDDLLALDEALADLEREEPDRAELVKLRFFAGLTLEEAAAALGVSRATASRHWTYARAWLFARVRGGPDGDDSRPAL